MKVVILLDEEASLLTEREATVHLSCNYLRDMSEGEEVLLAARWSTGLEESRNQGINFLLKVYMKIRFRGNRFIPDAAIPAMTHYHCLSLSEYEIRKGKWSTHRDGAVGWQFDPVEIIGGWAIGGDVQDVKTRAHATVGEMDEEKIVEDRLELPGWTDECEISFKHANPHADGQRAPWWGGCLEDFAEEPVVDLVDVKQEQPVDEVDDEELSLADLKTQSRRTRAVRTAVPTPEAKRPQLEAKPANAGAADAQQSSQQTLETFVDSVDTQQSTLHAPHGSQTEKTSEAAPGQELRRIASQAGVGAVAAADEGTHEGAAAVPGAAEAVHPASPQGRVAGSLAEGLNFTEYYLSELEKMSPDLLPGDYESALELIADRMDNAHETDSTSFSGVEAPMCSRRMLHHGLQRRLGRSIRQPTLLHMTEWEPSCQRELLAFDDGACLFGDISDFFRDELSSLIAGLKEQPALALETLAPLLDQKKLIKRKVCCIRPAFRHTDVTIIYQICFMALRLEMEETEVVQENVESFPVQELLGRFMSQKYYVDLEVLDPLFYGMPVSRRRLYVKMCPGCMLVGWPIGWLVGWRHRHKILAQLSPLSNFCKRFTRAVAYSWAEFFWMHETEGGDGVLPDELNAELAWAQGRAGSMWHGKRSLKATDPVAAAPAAVCEAGSTAGGIVKDEVDDEAAEAELDLCPGVQNGGPFVRALTASEFENMEMYKWRWPGQAWQLNQVADVHGQRSNPHYMHALIKNCGLIFSESPPTPRWLSATELLPVCFHWIVIGLLVAGCCI
ncbi:unnamed protein product [Symbiodinium sp. KB8]|nr:unnamed protein product [Symbiodinium sp. KB8]